MMQKQLILLFIFGTIQLSLFSQNRFSFQIGSGVNFGSAILDNSFLETIKDIEIYEIHGNYGFNFRFGVNYAISKYFSLNGYINYINSKYEYDIFDKLTPDTPIQLDDAGEIKSKISTNNLGLSLVLK
ncbi:MAG: hypothetical protein R2771_03470 [Saprospiraceae bacterium]